MELGLIFFWGDMKPVKVMLSYLAVLALLLTLGGCSLSMDNTASATVGNATGTTSDSGSTENTADMNKLQLNLEAAEPIGIELVDYDGGFFSLKIPQGWTIETTGDYENFGFRLYDPEKPGQQIFFYGNMEPFLKSSEAKTAWQTYLSTSGYADAQVYADAPVLTPATAEQFFYTMSEFASFAAQYGINHQFPVLTDLEVLETQPRNSAIASAAVDDSILRVLFTQDGIPYEGLFAASVVDSMTSYMYNTDAGYYTVYLIAGISAQTDEFSFMEETLAQSLSSFQFSNAYIQQGVNQNLWETQAALAVGQTLSEAYDSYNNAWSNRQQTYDALSQKRSDVTLGYDRLYDTETGEAYRAEVGFYDEYDIHREDFANQNLQLVPDDDYELYGQPVSGYIYK